MKLKIIDIKELPLGASFRQDTGRLHQAVTKVGYEELEFVSTCDSLLFLVEQLKIEVHHLSMENTALKTDLNRTREVIKKEASGWQWFQIYIGRILSILLAIYLVLKYGFKIKL